jgi:solute carrier family 25 aspartate/glutamate transporter 12/13
MYAQMKRVLMKGRTENLGLMSFLAGTIAGTTAASLSTPMDCIKTRVHNAAQPSALPFRQFFTRERQLIAHEWRNLIKHEGARALFKGIVPRCCIISPLFGITMFCYESFLEHFGGKMHF